LPELLSLECWGGATFDVAMRFLTEDPWERLAKIREGAPNILTQMLLRGSNGVGYTNYPDNVVRQFVAGSPRRDGPVPRVRLPQLGGEHARLDGRGARGRQAVRRRDVLHRRHHDPARAKYSLAYYVDLAKQLENAGAHIIGIKDMAGLLKPAAATALIKALKDATDLPIHLPHP
jgi:pyruvate carboxylase